MGKMHGTVSEKTQWMVYRNDVNTFDYVNNLGENGNSCPEIKPDKSENRISGFVIRATVNISLNESEKETVNFIEPNIYI